MLNGWMIRFVDLGKARSQQGGSQGEGRPAVLGELKTGRFTTQRFTFKIQRVYSAKRNDPRWKCMIHSVIYASGSGTKQKWIVCDLRPLL